MIKQLVDLQRSGKLRMVLANNPVEAFDYMMNIATTNASDYSVRDLQEMVVTRLIEFSGAAVFPIMKGNMSTELSHYVVLMDKTFLQRLSSAQRKHVLLHELGHILDIEKYGILEFVRRMMENNTRFELEVSAWEHARTALGNRFNPYIMDSALDTYRLLLGQERVIPKEKNEFVRVCVDVQINYLDLLFHICEDEEDRRISSEIYQEAVQQVLDIL